MRVDAGTLRHDTFCIDQRRQTPLVVKPGSRNAFPAS